MLGIGAALTCEALKLDCHVVQGYKSSAEAALSVTRGETDALYVPESSANHFVNARQNWALATIPHQIALLPEPAHHIRGGEDGCGRDLGWISSPISKSLAACSLASGIPPGRLAYLQEAVKQTLHNPQLIAEGEKGSAHRISRPVGTQQNVVAVVGSVTPEQRARVLKILLRD